MQTTRRERLMRMTSDESAYGFAIVVKALVCIGFLALLTVIAFSAGVNGAATPGPLSAGLENTSAHVAVRAEAHRKQVFDERRARFERAAPAQFTLTPESNKAPLSSLDQRWGRYRDDNHPSTAAAVLEAH